MAEYGKWIPALEKLPNEGTFVLVSYLSGSGIAMTVSYWFKDDRNKAHWGGENDYDVTHWMALPEMPKNVNGEP